MSTCKECKYFVKSEVKQAGKFQGFTPQPFGQQQVKAEQIGYCHLHPPGVKGQHLLVSEIDWCSYHKPKDLEQALNETADDLTE